MVRCFPTYKIGGQSKNTTSWCSCVKIVEGANPNTADDYTNALTATLETENFEMTFLLYVYGANPTIKDTQGYSALDMLGVNSEDFLNIVNNKLTKGESSK